MNPKKEEVSCLSEISQGAGCTYIIVVLLLMLIVAPALYGGAVSNIFGINDMSWGMKWVGSLSGLAPAAYFVSVTLKPYTDSPMIQLPRTHK